MVAVKYREVQLMQDSRRKREEEDSRGSKEGEG